VHAIPLKRLILSESISKQPLTQKYSSPPYVLTRFAGYVTSSFAPRSFAKYVAADGHKFDIHFLLLSLTLQQPWSVLPKWRAARFPTVSWWNGKLEALWFYKECNILYSLHS